MHRAYREGNLYEKLIAERSQAVADNPDDPDTHFALAQTYEWNDMPDEAIAAYERARELNPDSAVILDPLAKLYVSVDLEKAIPLYKRLIDLANTAINRIQRRRTLIDLYTRTGEYDIAIAEMLNAARSSEDEVERNVLLPSLWNLYRSQGRTAEGIGSLEALAAQLADSPTLQEVLGDAYKETGDPEKADAAYTQWVERRQIEIDRQGRSWGYFELVSNLLTKRVLPEKMVELAEHALQLEPSPRRKIYTGQAYAFNRHPEKVKELIQSETDTKIRHALVMLLVDYFKQLGEIDADVDSILRKDALHGSTPMEQKTALRGLWELYEAASLPSQATFVGEPPPSIKLNNLNGEEISISNFNGEVVLLNFWATWCPPCVRGIPQFRALHEQYNADGLVVVGVSLDRDGEDVVKSFVEAHGVTYPNLIADQDATAQFGGLASLPTTFLINRNGIVVKHYVGYTDYSVFQEGIKVALTGSR